MISHDRRFIFVHVGRTGGTTIERMAGMPVTDDPRTRAAGNTDFDGKHDGFQRYRDGHPREFRTYFKFTIVRNPFDRLRSSCAWRTRVVRDIPEMPLRAFIESLPTAYSFCERYALDGMSVHDSLRTFDHVARFENLAGEYRFLQARLGLQPGDAPHTNRTSQRPYQADYDPATIEVVRQRFGEDLKLLGYDFDDC